MGGVGAVERESVDDGAAREEAQAARQERLGGARADFVAALGKRVAELASSLRTWQGDPASPRARAEMIARVHALAAGARLLRFSRLAEELVTCEKVLDAMLADEPLRDELAAKLRSAIARIPALAWGETSLGEPARSALPAGMRPSGGKSAQSTGERSLGELLRGGPLTVLVVGRASIADAITGDDGGAASDAGCEVERTDDAAGALELARALAPDVIVVDTEIPGTRALVGALLGDPLTEAVPVIALGAWTKAEEAAPFVALGVARALAKPVSPDLLQRECAEAAATYLRREVARTPLGTMTLDGLGTRLAEELKRGLCDAAGAKARVASVDLGEGDEVMAALWGAVARIRDLVTIRSRGVVQFSSNGPEGALPLAPWLGSEANAQPATVARASTEAAGRARSAVAERAPVAANLDGVTIVVADDDPAVTWFLAGALRAAGATVHEAHDGKRALELAFRYTPDLVISDVLMPGLDGFALCRALKRDVVLRDAPVILLSWKEDLLQRVRELGADADGYLRKEASAGAIVQRVREVMRPRQRVAQRLAAGGEVRGRLDGLTARTLLALACTSRPSSSLTVRDATFLYEVEIRGGRPVRATRTAIDGTFERGTAVLAGLLGVGAGRFVVAPAAQESTPRSVRIELEGSLGEQLVPLVASARAAQRLLSGAELVHVERVGIASARLSAYFEATPEPARSLLSVLAAGESPRALLLSGQAPARLLEDVLCDAAAHGAIVEVVGTDGFDRFAPAVELEAAVLRGLRMSSPPAAMLPAPEGLLPLTPFAGAVFEDPREEAVEEDLGALDDEPWITGRQAGEALEEEEDDDDDDGALAKEESGPVAITEPHGKDDLEEDLGLADSIQAEPSASRRTPDPATIDAGWGDDEQAAEAEPHAESAAPERISFAEPEAIAAPEEAPIAHVEAPAPFPFEEIQAVPAERPEVDVGAEALLRWSERSPIGEPLLGRGAERVLHEAEPAHVHVLVAPVVAVGTTLPEAREPDSDPRSAMPSISDPFRGAAPVAQLPPAMVPASARTHLLAQEEAAPPRDKTLGPVLTLSFTPPPATTASAAEAADQAADPVPAPAVAEAPRKREPERDDARRERDDATPPARGFRRPSSYAPEAVLTPRKEPRDIRFTMWLLFAAAGVVFAVGARWSRNHDLFGGAPAPEPGGPPATAAPAAAAPAPVAAQAKASAEPAQTAPPEDELVSVQDLPLRAGDKLATGQGRLEIIAGSSDTVLLDGQMVGKGPVVRLVLQQKTGPKAEYEVRVRSRGEERVRYVTVKEGRLARVRVAPPWNR